MIYKIDFYILCIYVLIRHTSYNNYEKVLVTLTVVYDGSVIRFQTPQLVRNTGLSSPMQMKLLQ